MIPPHLPPSTRGRRANAWGFTLIELLVVLGIISVMAAVSLPNIIGFVRSSRIRTAQDTVASAIQRARAAAIMRNTQMGVTLVVQNNTTFWVHIEDTIAGVTTGNVGFTRQAVNFASPNSVLSTQYVLPVGVEFAAVAADCPAIPTFTPTQASLRFDRFGVSSLPPASGANALVLASGSATVTRIFAPAAADRAICLIDRRTGLRRWLRISPGGRVIRG